MMIGIADRLKMFFNKLKFFVEFQVLIIESKNLQFSLNSNLGGTYAIKLLIPLLMLLPPTFTLVLYLQVRLEPTQIENYFQCCIPSLAQKY
jgi:hypothetical protein